MQLKQVKVYNFVKTYVNVTFWYQAIQLAKSKQNKLLNAFCRGMWIEITYSLEKQDLVLISTVGHTYV